MMQNYKEVQKMDFYNKHYIRIDEKNRIIEGFSDAFENPLETDICINENGGRQFELCGYINPNLVNEYWCHLFIYENGEVREATKEELEEEQASFPVPEHTPTDVEILQEQMLDTMEMQADLLMEMCELQLASE